MFDWKQHTFTSHEQRFLNYNFQSNKNQNFFSFLWKRLKWQLQSIWITSIKKQNKEDSLPKFDVSNNNGKKRKKPNTQLATIGMQKTKPSEKCNGNEPKSRWI